MIAGHFYDLGWSPDEEASLLALRVSILCRIEAAARLTHLTGHVVERLFDDASIERLAGDLPGMQIHASQLRVVVEHFLEVRDKPDVIDRIAVESTAELVINASMRHRIEARGHHVEQRRVTGGQVPAQDELDDRRLGKLRRPAPAAVRGIEGAPQSVHGGVKN